MAIRASDRTKNIQARPWLTKLVDTCTRVNRKPETRASKSSIESISGNSWLDRSREVLGPETHHVGHPGDDQD